MKVGKKEPAKGKAKKADKEKKHSFSRASNVEMISKSQNLRNRKLSKGTKGNKVIEKTNNSPQKLKKVDSRNGAKQLTVFSIIKKFSRAIAKLTRNEEAETYFNDSIVQSELKGQGGIRRKRRFWFVLGIVMGIVMANIVVKRSEFTDPQLKQFQSYLNMKMGDIDFAYYLPEKDVFNDTLNQFLSFSKLDSFINTQPKIEGLFEPAKTMKLSEELKPKHHVVMIPGVVTSGLESWCTNGCFSKYFRSRVWGTTAMFKALIFDKTCWYNHMLLDEVTGLDPPGIKLRVAKGLESADYFMTGYWVWAKIIDNLSEIGYDNIMMHMASYDWRLSIPDLEKRDSYYSQLKSHIETAKKTSNKKVVVISHSMGSSVFSYFLNWVESPKFGNGGPSWVEDHIETWINAAGAMLGASKAFPALLSGESGELIQPVTKNLLENYMSRQDRASLFRNWGSMSSILPKGGNFIWGDKEDSPDNIIGPDGIFSEKSNGVFVEVFNKTSGEVEKSLSIDEALELLKENSDANYIDRLNRNYNIGIFTKQKEFDDHKGDNRTFSNPLTFQLPNAPSMKIYNLYGVGHNTERRYKITFNDEYNNLTEEVESAQSKKPKIKYVIDTDVNDPNNTIHSGIKYSFGDGSVNLVSLGIMGSTLWRTRLYNPHSVRIITKEFAHNLKPFYYGIFEDPEISDHIGILGNHDFLKTVLRIVSGNHTFEDQFYSNIREIGANINHKLG